MRYLGAHVSASGGLKNSIKNGEKLSVNSIQTMFSAPMRWSTKEIAQEQVDEMAQEAVGSGIEKILFHGVYLINLARMDKQMFHMSKMSVQTHLDASYRLEQALQSKGATSEVLGVTFHPGSAKDCKPDEAIERISYGLNWILEQVEGGTLLLESSAGAGSVMGATLEQLAAMREGVEQKDRVGYVLDTQHMFVSGYDWRNNLEEIIENIDKTLGLELVKSFHLNDSLQPFDSHKDRHANIGEGEIGLEAITALVNHPKLKEIPFILETPALKAMETAQVEVKNLKELSK
jgi:deoxyribonuclease-4